MQLQKELEMFVSSKPYQEKAREITLFGKKKKDSSCLTVIYTRDFFRIFSCGYLKVTALVSGGSYVFSLTRSWVYVSLHKVLAK